MLLSSYLNVLVKCFFFVTAFVNGIELGGSILQPTCSSDLAGTDLQRVRTIFHKHCFIGRSYDLLLSFLFYESVTICHDKTLKRCTKKHIFTFVTWKEHEFRGFHFKTPVGKKSISTLKCCT